MNLRSEIDSTAPPIAREVPEKDDTAELVDRLESLPESQREVVYQKLEIYQGDLPHPKILAEYSKLYPGAPKGIIENGLAESRHRRELESKEQMLQYKFKIRGQIFGFIVALCIIGGGIFLIHSGHTVTGSIMAGVTAIGVIGLFTGNAKVDEKNNSEE